MNKITKTSYLYPMIDIGVNFTDPVFRGIYHEKQKHMNDADLVLKRAKEIGVEKIIITGGSLAESNDALKLARMESQKDNKPLLYSTVGVHPTRCNELAEDESRLEKLKELCLNGIEDGKIVAIGECGLDYDRLQFCPKDTQLKYFEKQFELAQFSNLPMFLHNRNTNGDFTAMVRKHRDSFSTGVVHSFTGNMEEAKEIIDMDLYIGINGCSLKTDENIEVMKSIPLSKLMIETDAPWCDIRSTHAGYKYLNTRWNQKKAEKYEIGCMVKNRNEPCTLRQVLEVIAGAREIDIDQLSKIVYQNTQDVFFPSIHS